MWWTRSSDPETYQAPTGIPDPDTQRELVLYKFDACPYCVRVCRALDAIGLEIAMEDTRTDPEVRQRLYSITGRTQVPCLFVDDVPFFESADIIDWLNAYAIRGAKTVS